MPQGYFKRPNRHQHEHDCTADCAGDHDLNDKAGRASPPQGCPISSGRSSDGGDLGGCCAAEGGEDAVTMLEDTLDAALGLGVLTSSGQLRRQRGREGR